MMGRAELDKRGEIGQERGKKKSKKRGKLPLGSPRVYCSVAICLLSGPKQT